MSRITSGVARVAVIVVVLAVAGAGTATAAKLITGAQIKNRSLTGKDVKKRSLSANLLTKKARAALSGQQGPAGPAGPAGIAGPKGDKGEKGDMGPSNAIVAMSSEKHDVGIPVSSHTVESITVGKGNWTYNVAMEIQEGASQAAVATCELREQIGDFYEVLSRAKATLASSELSHISLSGASHVDVASTNVSVVCTSDKNFLDVTFRSLTAIQVATLTEG